MAQGLDIALFAAQTLGGTYGNPEPTLLRNRGTYQGQCVSFERQRLSAIEGVNWGSVGNAVDYANASNQARYKAIGYTWKPGDTSFKDGDVLVWGDDAGSWTGKEGHISTWFNGKLLNQNFGGSLKVTQNNFFPAGYLGRYTKEGEKPVAKPSLDKVKEAFSLAGATPNAGQLSYYQSNDISVLNNDALYGATKPTADEVKTAWKVLGRDATDGEVTYYVANSRSTLYKNLLGAVKQQLDDLQASKPAPDSEASKKLQAIKDALK